MAKFGAGVVLILIVRVVILIALALGGAYALTTYVSLPGFVDVLIWFVAAGYSVLCAIGVLTVLAGLLAATDNAPKRRTRR